MQHLDWPSENFGFLKHIFAPVKQFRVAILFFLTLDLKNNARNGFYTPNYPTEELFLSLNDNWLTSENFEHHFLSESI